MKSNLEYGIIFWVLKCAICDLIINNCDVADENIMKKTGRVLMTAELGEEYGFVDINGEDFLSDFFFAKICNDEISVIFISSLRNNGPKLKNRIMKM